MPNNPHEKQSGNDFFAALNAFNSIPAFGQSWSGPGWNNMPMANHNPSGSFQPGFPLPQNDQFDQNQLINPHEYSEDDDFYETEKGHSKNTAVDSNERRKTSLTSHVNTTPNPKSKTAPQNTPAAVCMAQSQEEKGSLPTPVATATKSLSNKGSDARLSELRQKLLASKRASSATPIPSNDKVVQRTVVDGTTKHAMRPENVVNSEANPKTEEGSFTAATTRGHTNFPEKKSSSGVANLPRSAPAQSDIQGLIDEYRAPDTAIDPKEPSELTMNGEKKKDLARPEANKVGSEPKRIEKTKLRAVNTNTPLKPPSGSPGSSESGEIRSDQDLVTPISGNDPVQSSVRKSEDKPSSALNNSAATNAPDKTPLSKIQQGDTHTLKQSKASGTPKQVPKSRATGQRQAAKPAPDSRVAPLAPKSDQTHKGAHQAPKLRDSPGNQPQRRFGGDQYNSHPPADAKALSASSGPAPLQAYQKAHDKVQKRQQGSEQVVNGEHVARSQEQNVEQNESSSLPRADVAINGHLSKKEKELQDKPTIAGLSSPTPLSSDKSHQARGREDLDRDLRNNGRNILSSIQQEQIQNLGIDLTSEGLRDLYEFLEYHRFFVKEYREGFLIRQRRLRALEAEKLALERESLMQYELFNSIRAQSLAARERTEPPTLVRLQDSKESIEVPLGKPMPPPLSLPRKSQDEGVIAIKGRASMVEAISPKYPASRANGDLTPRVLHDSVNLKRQHLDDDDDFYQSRKSSRMDIDGQKSDRSQQVSPRTSRSDFQILDRRRLSDYRATDYGHRDRSRSPNHRPRSLSPYRKVPGYPYLSRQNSWAGSYPREGDQSRPSAGDLRRGSAGARCRNCDRIGHLSTDCRDTYRGASNDDSRAQRRGDHGFHNNQPAYSGRGNRASSSSFRGGLGRGRNDYQSYKPGDDSVPYNSSPARHGVGVPSKSDPLNLKAGDSRYFMIKSWNQENVEAAQRDCIWATQSKNLNILTEAFNSCRNVILVFSVNGSRAFQGYARMQSLPSPDIPAPEWQKVLIWSSTEPFRIEWITVAETRFHAVGHLKNTYNEGQAVLIGRDGQEIEEGCGRALCELIDEAAREEARYGNGY